MKNNILHLTLKKKWFDMILSGEKTEEYREIKPYWNSRLMNDNESAGITSFKNFDIIRFKNGYTKNAPQFDIELKAIYIGSSKIKWGGNNKPCYVLRLGKIINTLN